MMKRVYLIRHGESEANVQKIHGGGHHPLTERGLAQAKFIAQRCTKLPLQKLFASTMVRAQQTAEEISKVTGLPIATSNLLGEIQGPSEYMEREIEDTEVAAAFQKINREMGPGVRHSDEENFDDLIERAANALELFAATEEQNIAVVTHGFFLRIMMARAVFGADISPRELNCFMHGFKSENTGITVLEYNTENTHFPWRIFTWNDHAHLG